MRLQFGEFIVDDGTRQLLRSGRDVHMSPKAFDLLLALIHARPRVLSKAELHAQLWPKVYVSDASLAMVIAEVRVALGERAREPRFVRTVHRHGYAFPAEAHALKGGAAGGAPSHWLETALRQYPLGAGDHVIGRDPRAAVFLDEPSVSRRHARLAITADVVTLEDLGSKNGTTVRDERISTVTPLADGDEIRIGSVRVVVRSWAADPTRTAAGLP